MMDLSKSKVYFEDQNSDLPILSKDIKIDKKLKFSNEKEEFRKIIADSIEPITTLEQKLRIMNEMLQNPVSLPNNYVFATLSNELYRGDVKLYKGENGRDLHGTIVHPEIGNWKLLTVAYDPRFASANGYCGAAYWNPDAQQVIIAHCGTKNKGGVYNDFYGVFRNEHVPQIDSAMTLTDKILSVLEEINREKLSNIQLFFTGHSLGAWLASITAFSAKFLKRNENDYFVANPDFENSGYHSSTVIFDGPGCQKMLERIQCRLMNRYGSCFVSSLDITNYLSAPHFINACNLQVGDVYRLFIPLTEEDKEHLESLRNKSFFQKILLSAKRHSVEMHVIVYTAIMHKMENLKKVFNPETGEVLEDNGNLRIQKVTDWPLLISSSEKEALKNKFSGCGMKTLEVLQNLYSEVNVMLTAPTVLEGLTVGYVCKVLQSVSDVYKNSTKWYKDLIHELDSFLRVANETNNYDPAQISNSVATGREIRYKTEFVDQNYKNSHNLNVFENHELRFLVEYKTLEEYDNHLHVIVELKEVFDAFKKDEELLNNVMKILEECRIENGVIHCRNVRERIVYIKKMLHLFPDIHRKVTEAYKGLPSEVPSRYYNKLSELYLNSFQNTLEFEKDTLGLKDFLENADKKILHLTKFCTTFEADRTHKTFKMVCKDFPAYESHNIFLNLSRIFDLGSDVFISYLKKVYSEYLLCIECDDILHGTLEKLLRDLFEMLQENGDYHPYNLKLILITKKESDVNCFVRECFVNKESISYKALSYSSFHDSSFFRNFNYMSTYREERSEVSFDDLTPESQKKLLDETVLFQGKKMPLWNVVKDCSRLNNIINPETIVDLYKKNLIGIGNVLPCLGDAENYYIDRQVVQNVKVKNDILWDEELITSNTLIAISNFQDSSREDISALIRVVKKSNEKDPEENHVDQIVMLEKDIEEEHFARLCIDNPSCNIHWLEKKEDNLIWKVSHGKSLDAIRKHMEHSFFATTTYSVQNPTVKLVDFNDIDIFDEKIVIIAAESGMGKTIAFTHLGTTWFGNNTKSYQWIVRINLIEHKKELNKKKLFESVFDIITFFFDNVSQLTKNLLESRLVESGDIVFLLDGFDDISSVGQENIIDLVRLLQDTKVERVLISTRLYLRKVLEDNFSTFAYTLKPFLRRDQEDFLMKFWKDVNPDIDAKSMERFINKVLDYISESIGDVERKFMGVPLQMRMIAEVFRSYLSDEILMEDLECNFTENCNILNLYNRFVNIKYREYFRKIGAESIDLEDDMEEDWFVRPITEVHRVIAFRTLFPEDASDFKCEKRLSEKDKLKINRVGIVQIINDEAVFIHKTFAEYYVAGFLAHRLNQKEDRAVYETTLNFLRKEFFKIKNDVIRLFLVHHLARESLFDAFLARKWDVVLNELTDPQKMHAVDILGRNIWHYVIEGNVLPDIVDMDIGKRLIKCSEFYIEKKDYLGKTPIAYIDYPLLIGTELSPPARAVKTLGFALAHYSLLNLDVHGLPRLTSRKEVSAIFNFHRVFVTDGILLEFVSFYSQLKFFQ